MGSYLGERVDPETQACREIYGMRLELTLSLDIYSPPGLGAAGCDSALETLHQVMLGSLPSGLRPTELRWEETGLLQCLGNGGLDLFQSVHSSASFSGRRMAHW